MNHLVIAGKDIGDFIIPIIVGIFWVVSQIAGAAAKKKQPPRRPPASNENSSEEDPIAELLQTIGVKSQYKVPYPPERDNPEFLKAVEDEPNELPEFVPQNPWQPGEIETLPDGATLYSEPAEETPPLRREPPVPPLVPAKKPVEIADIDIRPTMRSFRSSIPTIRMPSLDLNFQTLEKTGGKFPTFGKIIDPSDKQSLRRAMLSHIIFSKPKALGNGLMD